MEHQDWTPVVFRKTNSQTTPAKEGYKAMSKMTAEEALQRKLDQSEEKIELPKPTVQLRLQVQKARQVKNWTQEDLAKAVNVRKEEINKFESGQLMLSSAVLNKVKRVLSI
jgi:ribosome-binding protein aMBF1 (putative translation factor)